jgi:hypothetical protein
MDRVLRRECVCELERDSFSPLCKVNRSSQVNFSRQFELGSPEHIVNYLNMLG